MLNEVNVNILIKLVRSKDASLLRHVPSRLQSDDHEDRDVREKSQAVAVGILGSWHTPRRWKTVRQNIPLDASCVRRLPCRRVFETSVTRNCFPVNCQHVSSSG